MAPPGGSLASQVINTYTTFSGIDITAIFDNLVLATLSGVATSLTREKVPVFTVGSANARSISRGKRACAGSLQFTLFDRDAFYELFLDESHFYYAHADEVNYLTDPVNAAEWTGLFFQTDDTGAFLGTQIETPGISIAGSAGSTGLEAFAGGGAERQLNITGDGDPATTGIARGSTVQNTKVGALSVRRAAQHADQVYPFDITLAAQNEYGRASACAIIGVEIINEGGGISVDDITNEQQMTYIAITKTPWTPQTEDGPRESLIGAISSITPNLGGGREGVDLNAQGAAFSNVIGGGPPSP